MTRSASKGGKSVSWGGGGGGVPQGSRGVCIKEGSASKKGGLPPRGSASMGVWIQDGIRSTNGWYASYWNAFLFAKVLSTGPGETPSYALIFGNDHRSNFSALQYIFTNTFIVSNTSFNYQHIGRIIFKRVSFPLEVEFEFTT